MVNNPKLRLLDIYEEPLVIDDSNRIISGGPVYNLDIVKGLIFKLGIFVINTDAKNDATNSFNPPMDESEIMALINELHNGLYNNSVWALTSANSKVQCDSYTIRWNRNRQKEWEHGNKLYIKFGFRPNSEKCLILSIHHADY